MAIGAEVCIVGAGPAGSLVAAELVRHKIATVLIEAGPRHDPSRRAEYARQLLAGVNPWRTPIPEMDRYTTGGTTNYPLELHRARGVGGGTLHWEGYSVRFHADDFRLRTRHGVADDWPISYETLEPYYARAERALGVAGVADDPWASPRSAAFPLPAFPLSYSDQLLARAVRRLDVAVHHLPQARNSIAYDSRPPCSACSTCHACPTGAKASVDLTHVHPAEATGRLRVLPDTAVLRLETDAGGRVARALCAGRDRREFPVSARVFVVAAGAVDTARLLLLSTSSTFPGGLANRSGLVGTRFMSHPSVDVVGRMRERVYPYRIGFSTAMSRQFAVARNRAREGAFLLELLNSASPPPAVIAALRGGWGADLRQHVREEFGRMLGIRIYVEQLPDPANAVTVDRAVTDYFGQPVPRLTYGIGRYERDTLDEAKIIAGRLLEVAGATELWTTELRFASHQLGTCRMGRDPRTSVVDADLRAHDVDNLYLVGGGAFATASSSPPTLTIAALALRAADHLVGRLRPARV